MKDLIDCFSLTTNFLPSIFGDGNESTARMDLLLNFMSHFNESVPTNAAVSFNESILLNRRKLLLEIPRVLAYGYSTSRAYAFKTRTIRGCTSFSQTSMEGFSQTTCSIGLLIYRSLLLFCTLFFFLNKGANVIKHGANLANHLYEKKKEVEKEIH